MAVILTHVLTASSRSKKRLLDEAAKDIILDIDELELYLIKKKMLVDDYEKKIRGLN